LFFQRGAELVTSSTTLDKVRSIRLRLPIGVFLHKIWADMVTNFKRTRYTRNDVCAVWTRNRKAKGLIPAGGGGMSCN
jgi:hypothetical protein